MRVGNPINLTDKDEDVDASLVHRVVNKTSRRHDGEEQVTKGDPYENMLQQVASKGVVAALSLIVEEMTQSAHEDTVMTQTRSGQDVSDKDASEEADVRDVEAPIGARKGVVVALSLIAHDTAQSADEDTLMTPL